MDKIMNFLLADKFSKETRSFIMSKICSKNTKPEIIVRKSLWANGMRFRIHDKSIIGIPDISSKPNKLAIFIDGCFWHGCKKCYKEPKTNRKFWKKKLESNKSRRRKVLKELKKDKWTVLAFWEHDINKNLEKVTEKINSKYFNCNPSAQTNCEHN